MPHQNVGGPSISCSQQPCWLVQARQPNLMSMALVSYDPHHRTIGGLRQLNVERLTCPVSSDINCALNEALKGK